MSEPLPNGLEPTQPWRARAQVVSARPGTRLEGDVEVAVVMRVPSGGFVHRRVVCNSKDLAPGMPDLLFDPDPDPALLRARAPSRVRTVRDRTFDTFDEAVASAEAGEPPANPDAWVDQEVLRWEVVDAGSAVGSGAEDQDLELLGVVIGCMVGMSVAWLWMLGAFWVDDRLGLNTPAGRDSVADNIFGFFACVGGVVVTWWLAYHVPALLARPIRPIRLRPEPPTDTLYAPGGPDLHDSPGVPAVPIALRVTARTRNVVLAGWLGCGAAWIVAGLVAHVVEGEAGLTAFCIATGLVLGAVGGRGFRRRLVADTAGITIHNFLRRVSIPWGELRSVDVEPVDAVPVDSGEPPAGPHRLRFNERVSAEVPEALRRPGEYLFDLRETLLSMQRTYSMEGASPLDAESSTPYPHDAEASHHPQDIQDTLPTPQE